MFFSTSSSSALISCIMLSGTHLGGVGSLYMISYNVPTLGGWTTAGTLRSSVILYSPSNLPIPSKRSGNCWIRSCLSVMVCLTPEGSCNCLLITWLNSNGRLLFCRASLRSCVSASTVEKFLGLVFRCLLLYYWLRL